MTATTLSRPPTEADILDAIVRATELERFGECMDAMAGLRANLDILATAAAWFLSESAVPTKEGNGVWEPSPESVPGVLWRDLRPSEADRLVELVNAATERAAERCEAIILEELTAAGVAFAAEHPDAPRGEPEKGEAS